jgi:coenzyme F420-reducing hydrogenase gamma subunit
VFKFASCDGCQLTLLDCEDELLTVAGEVEIAQFLELSSAISPASSEDPYDVSLVEGSITTLEDAARIREIRAASRVLVTIGACATSGGVQALRNWGDVEEFKQAVYARPEWIQALATSTPIAEHVPVDFELRGCPIDKGQLLEVLAALLHGRRPNVPTYSVCIPCKRRGTVCVTVARGIPCLGPVTQAGCGALCPTYTRGCYGCFAPAESPNTAALSSLCRDHGMSPKDLQRVYQTYNAAAPAFREASQASEAQGD